MSYSYPDDHQYVEKDSLVAPGVVDELDEFGNFVVRHYDDREFDENGDEIFDDDDDE